MATILERFNKLGIAHSNHVLQLVGMMVSHRVGGRYTVHKKQQEEPDGIYMVNDYNDKLTGRIDFEIINWLNRKPTKVELNIRRQWWHDFKFKRQLNTKR